LRCSCAATRRALVTTVGFTDPITYYGTIWCVHVVVHLYGRSPPRSKKCFAHPPREWEQRREWINGCRWPRHEQQIFDLYVPNVNCTRWLKRRVAGVRQANRTRHDL
jgi:hypothetical protein